MSDAQPYTTAQNAARILLGSSLIFAGISHFTFARKGFQAQVPDALPLNKDFVVLASGVVEVGLGAALLMLVRQRETVGKVAATFFTAIFPGNISQYLRRDSSLGLDTDGKRAVRLVFQPLLVLWALWSTGVWPRTEAPKPS